MFDILLQSTANLLLKCEENLCVWCEEGGEVHLKCSYFQRLSEKYSHILPARMTKEFREIYNSFKGRLVRKPDEIIILERNFLLLFPHLCR